MGQYRLDTRLKISRATRAGSGGRLLLAALVHDETTGGEYNGRHEGPTLRICEQAVTDKRPLDLSAARLAWAVFAGALLVRLACYHAFAGDFFLKYPALAALYLSGQGEATRPFTASPLYLFYWIAVGKLLGGSIIGGRLLQLVVGAANCALIAVLGRRLFDTRAGLLAGIAAALYLPFIVHDGTFVSATLVTFANLSALWLLARYRQGQRIGLAAGGLLLGLSACARPNALLLAPFFGLWALRRPRTGSLADTESETGRRRPWPAIIFTLTVLVPPALVTARNYRVAHDFVPVMSDGGIVFYLGNNEMDTGFMYCWPRYEDLFRTLPGEVDPTHRVAHEIAERETGRSLRPSQSSAFWMAQGLRFMREQPRQYLWLVARKLAYTWTGYEAHDVASAFDSQDALARRPWFLRFAPVGALGLTGAFWFRRRLWELLPLYGILLAYTLTGAWFTVVARYRIPMIPALLWFGAGLVAVLLEAIRKREFRRLIAPLAGAACLFAAMSYRNYPMQALDAQYRIEREHLAPAEGALRAGRFKRAELHLRQTIAARATFMTVCRAYGLLAVVYEGLGNEPRAQEYRAIGRARAVSRGHTDLLLPPPQLAGDPVFEQWQEGVAHYRAGHPAQARRAFTRLCHMVPNLAPAHHCLGVALIAEGRTQINPQQPGFQHGLSLALEAAKARE